MNINKISIITALTLVTSLPIISLGYPLGHDWLYELVRVSEYRAAMLDGQYPPFWGVNLYGGLGSPIFIYYAPLYLFISSLLVPLAGSIESSSALALIIISFAGMVFMYLFLAELHKYYEEISERSVRIGLYLFALSPYLLADKFFRNANAEYTALCMAPLAFYGVFLMARKRLSGVVVLSAGISATTLAHNLTALTVTAICVFLSLVLHRKRIHLALGGGGLGLAIALFFWLPALSYQSLVRTDLLTVGKFNYETQYKTLSQYFGYSEFYSIGVVTLLVIAIGSAAVVMAFRANYRKDMSLAVMVAVLFCTLFIFLQLPISALVWSSVPLMELFQFPWRMMGPLALATAVTGALAFTYTKHLYAAKYHRAVEFSVILICLANALPHFVKVATLPTLITLKLPTILSSEYIRENALPATVMDEYLPSTADTSVLSREHKVNQLKADHPGSDQVQSSAGGSYAEDMSYASDGQQAVVVAGADADVSITILRNERDYIVLDAVSEQSLEMRIARWYYPVWSTYIDSIPVEARADSQGLINLTVPKGRHKVEARLHPPLIRQLAIGISILSIVLWLIIAVVALRNEGVPSFRK